MSHCSQPELRLTTGWARLNKQFARGMLTISGFSEHCVVRLSSGKTRSRIDSMGRTNGCFAKCVKSAN